MTHLISWWPEVDQLIFSTAGAIIGGSLVAWLAGYYSEKGRRELISKEFPKLLEQAKLTAYEEQKSKNLATREDIAGLVEQVRAVTKEAEEIKAEIQSAVADRDRQMKWRIEVYLEAIEAIARLNGALAQFGNLDFPDDAITAPLTLDSARVSKIQLVASNETITATNLYLEAWTKSFLEISTRRLLLRLRLGDLDETQKSRERLEFVRYCTLAALDLNPLLVGATVAARIDLGIDFDATLYTSQTSEIASRVSAAVANTFGGFLRLLN
jgi:hypothetical protein